MKHYIGVDLGGTNIVAGLVGEDGSILDKASRRTNAPRSPESICGDIVELCEELLERNRLDREVVEWVGVGSPGVICGGVIGFAANLEFHDVPLAAMLEERLSRRAFLQNDGNAAAFGEYVAGAGVGHRSLCALTIGTGIGGGIVLDGRIHEGFNGCAAEFGHMVVHAGGRTCGCGKRGCLEAYCSASALRALTREEMERSPGSLLWKVSGGSLKGAGGKTAFQAMAMGDEAGRRVVELFLDYLSVGVANVLSLLQPEVLCIGGGVSREGDAIILPLRERVEGQVFVQDPQRRTKIVTAQLGNDAGLIGAALLGRQETERAGVATV